MFFQADSQKISTRMLQSVAVKKVLFCLLHFSQKTYDMFLRIDDRELFLKLDGHIWNPESANFRHRALYIISTAVSLCAIVLPVFFSSSASIDRALITQQPIELETSRFRRKFCLITPSQLFQSNIIVWVPNSQQTLKQKFCYLYNGRLIKRRQYLSLIITFVCTYLEETM